MQIPPTQRRTNEFDTRNLVLQLALGGIAFSRRLDELVSRYGKGPLRLTPVELSPEDQQLVDFVLGVVALRRHFGALVEDARAQPRPTRFDDPPDPPEPETPAPPPRDLLR